MCLQHIEQIKRALGFFGVVSTAHSWTGAGAQVDLLIDRSDNVVNVCEMKYSRGRYVLAADEAMKMQHRVDCFVRETATEKAVHLTLVTTHGLAPSADVGFIQSQLTQDDLFL